MLKLSDSFQVKVDFVLEVDYRLALLRALVFSSLQTTSKIPVNQNTEVVAQQVALLWTSSRAC